MSEPLQLHPGDRIKVELVLIRPLDKDERVTFTTGETQVINNIRGNYWWAGTRTDFPMCIVALDDIDESQVIRPNRICPWCGVVPDLRDDGKYHVDHFEGCLLFGTGHEFQPEALKIWNKRASP